MADEREEDMLELMREVHMEIQQLQNTVNDMWAEWTRLHEPTIDRSGPKPKKMADTMSDIPRRKVVRRG